ncbi:putative oxidoreductase [Exophiala viscosa]|uniref:D-xylose 1-dehydrogenase (NADP(+), D-xylono-1,5-lactone-forming) n=1 Tax=Exophiala viscosa TaxID=2486360 RepID=A0AAN6DZZ1_9EURO|nr:putative oxidoreductase [Exophiala viscosa]KAI1622222.1 putative oxidoreductase [Exophiala viscosa]
MSTPKVVRWGMMATGGIVRTFTKDVLLDPSTRNVTDIRHAVTAVASSSSISSAEKFISEVVSPTQSTKCTPYGSYEDLVKDPNVDMVYIGTPHSHHYQNAMLALSHNKPVLCEKALTVNAAQAKILYKTAKEKNLFFMEAVWTRYFPLSKAIRKHIMDNDLGEVVRVTADLSINAIPEDSFDVGHRMVNLDLAGGCLLDLGIYSLTWVFQTLYHTLPASSREENRPKVVGTAMTFEPRTHADESTLILLEFPKSTPSGKTTAHAVATAAMRVSDDPAREHGKPEAQVPSVRIQGEKGEIQVWGPIYRPTRYRLVPTDKDREIVDRTFEFEGGAHGMMYEADAAAYAWLAGELESESMTWAESTLIMEIMDEARHQAGLTYPDDIETTEYPVKLKARAS